MKNQNNSKTSLTYIQEQMETGQFKWHNNRKSFNPNLAGGWFVEEGTIDKYCLKQVGIGMNGRQVDYIIGFYN
jgi:hypothetical protein